MNPLLHARIHAKKFGGIPDDYLPINNFLDGSLAGHASVKHRAALHHGFGITVCEQVFGQFIVNSNGKQVPVRDIAGRHIIEDLGFIPDLSDYLNNMQTQNWMSGTEKHSRVERKSKFIKMEEV
jgi:hypothetical protein